jgi:uncharacterized protein YjiS (DUF1127 family)
MHALKRDVVYEFSGLTGPFPPRRRSLAACLETRLAIGQILREQFVYEVHGPYVCEAELRPARPSPAWRFAGVPAWLNGVAHWLRLHRAENEIAVLDDRLLRDIGLAPREVHDAVFGAGIRANHC